MNDFYLKAASESELYAAVESAGVLDAEQMVCPGYALDVIGTIYQDGLDANGEPMSAAIPGFHANLRGELTQEQMDKLPLIAQPANPVRVWA